MGKIDTIIKKYMENPIVFADAFNQFLYHGDQKINPTQLTELDTSEILIPYGVNDASVPEQFSNSEWMPRGMDSLNIIPLLMYTQSTL